MKKFISILLTVALMFSMTATVFAGGGLPQNNQGAPAATTGTTGGNKVTIIEPDTSKAEAQFGGLTKGILGIVKWVAMAFAVGMLLYIAIKYMMSAANEKADLKKGLINYVIGAALLFGTTFILNAIQNWMSF